MRLSPLNFFSEPYVVCWKGECLKVDRLCLLFFHMHFALGI